jgi:photosystem II stability/assembly factor-like uncharacterized protein
MKKTILILFFLFSCLLGAQQDSSKQPIHTQYRRGTILQQGYQTYEQKYQGKDLQEEKRRLYPLNKVTSGTGIWTELNPKVPRVDYLGIHFVNVDTGWACGDLGTIIRTTDGGQSWQTKETNTTTPILKVNSFDGQIVITSGFSGLILRSSDGGESWMQITSGVTGDLWGLQMINDTLGWACGKSNSLIKTTDAGLTWTRIYTPGYTSDYWWVDFLNENYGFIAANGKVIRTMDGGNNWDIIQAGDNQALYSVDVIDSLDIAAAGYGGLGYTAKNIYSSDGGYTWINGQQLTTHEINCIRYVDPDTGYIVMSEIGMYKTTNQGQNWTGIEGINDIGEFEFQLFSENQVGYAAGTGLKIFKADGNIDIWHKLIINDDLVDVFFTSEQKGFVISEGMYGLLFRTTDEGTSWDTIQGVPGGGCITFTDSLNGFIGTSNSQIYKTTNGGESWYQTYGITNLIAKIFFINPQTGWAVGGPRIFKTTDAGENWFEQLYYNSAGFTSVYFIDSITGWTLLPIYNTTNGGENWIQRNDIPIYDANDVYFIDSIGFIVNFLELDKSTDSGNNWFVQFTSQYVIRTFGWLTNSHGFIIGDGVYETMDTGETWNEILELKNVGLRKLQSPQPYLGYSVGYNGLLYKYLDTTYIPVELIALTGKIIDNDKIQLSWTTASEENNYGFEIQKSNNKTDWDKVGFVNGNGTTTETHLYSFKYKIEKTGLYYYRLKQIDYDGEYKFSNILNLNVGHPPEFSLSQNYPNPFNSETNISFAISEETNVSLKLYTITGREIKVLVNKHKQPGFYTVTLKGGELSSGVYFYRLVTSSGFTAVKKLILLK